MDKQKGPVGDFIRECVAVRRIQADQSAGARARRRRPAPAYGPAARPGRATQAQNVNEWTASD